ncbi:trypsin-like serine protease [Mammaliicoccus sciuri]|uniref:trypsin-like serine protease n=1 Tax=Mammaliicoccus sciuri TaxID=1296 RepID=UPI0037B05BEA
MKKSQNIPFNIGEINFSINNKRSRGTASLIKGENNVLISTAGHCIYDWENKKIYNDIFLKFQGKKILIKEVILHKGWTEDAIVDYDTAFLVPDYTLLNKLKMDPLTPLFNYSYTTDCHILGFENKLFKSSFKHKLVATFKDHIYNSNLIGATIKFKSGVSGGPWIREHNQEKYQIANTSLSFKEHKNILWGAYWGNEIKKMYSVANGSNFFTDNIIKITL